MIKLKVIIWAITMLSAVEAHAGDLKMRFRFSGAHPVPPSEHLIVNPSNAGIKNIAVYLDIDRGELPAAARQSETHALTMSDRGFEPRLLAARAGDVLQLINRGREAYDVGFNFLANEPLSLTIPVGGRESVQLQRPEPAPFTVECTNPRMTSAVIVLNHAYVAVSDEDGNLTIKDLPEGEVLTFRVISAAAAGPMRSVTVDGKLQLWPRNRFSVTITPGVNEFGTVTLTGAHLR